ncbi:hypothetical protein Herbaro_11655 [Herbaspirillum sp. WKF16]|uniref:hypothetical protein n=1 Tax=Herbaspirillum sp. WKF16 TaxID=3028312 RepID=UPI0023A9456F|nr:hypothetical protein [Herbaspirillum sp. WKF16]WDZ94155.1 hypothetical protein Herbaro_11655 [Herbaspirillum sp. WKF16]
MAKHSTLDDTPSHATTLPEAQADRLLNDDAQPDQDDADAPADASQLRRREERHAPHSLDEESIGLDRVSGTDEEEIGKELNIGGAEDADEDEYGNTVSPDGDPNR